MSTGSEFLARVLARVPGPNVREYTFHHWSCPGRPTDEAVGLLPIPGADPDRVLARLTDIQGYVGNVNHVTECRAIPDPRFVPPAAVRLYHRIKVPLLGELHHEIVFERVPAQHGFEIAIWYVLEPETAALGTKDAMRSAYSDGAWLLAPGVIGYALSSAPRREDVGFLKWKALTTGADAVAAKVIRDTIESVGRWAAR